MQILRILLFIMLVSSLQLKGEPSPGFVSLFDGKTFEGWQLINKNGPGYGITNGILFCERGGGGKLFTTKEYENFILRLEFRLESGSNNGIGIRAPLQGDPAYSAIELQILDDTTTKYGPLRPAQMHGSIYDVVASKTGAQKPVGEWNHQEITADGRRIKVVLNGKTIVDVNLDDIKDPEILKRHPGLQRTRGYIGFLGHSDYVEFRNIQIRELPATVKK